MNLHVPYNVFGCRRPRSPSVRARSRHRRAGGCVIIRSAESERVFSQ